MKIISQEVKISTTIHYNDGCTKTIDYYKVYLDNKKTPELKHKIVEFTYPDGDIDEILSYDSKIINYDSDETSRLEYTDSEYDSEFDSDSESPNAK